MLHKQSFRSTTPTDLKMISSFLDSSNQPKIQPRNLAELSDILKNRLNKSSNSKTDQYKCRDWLK